MEVLNQLRSDTFDNVNSLFFKIGEGLISFMYALLVLIIGWVISKVVILFAKSTNGIQYRQNRH
jgi:hypothetical protein